MTRRLAWLCSMLLWSALARAQPAGPQPLESLEALLDEPVVTTASRSAEKASTAPATVFSITAEEIRVYGIRSVDEALAYLGIGMYVQKARDYNTGLDVGAQGIMLRDYGRHLLVLLDGHVMNSQASGQAPLHEGLGVPLEAIDHIEVMLGAGSVMYGANAMTAVVQIITKSAERDQGEHVVAELSMAAPQSTSGYSRLPGGEHATGFHYRLGVGSAHSFQLKRLPASFSVRAEWQQDLSQTYAVKRATGEDFQLRPDESSWGGVASHGMNVPSSVATLRLGEFTLRAQGSRYERDMPLVGTFDDPYAKEVRATARLDLSHSHLLTPQLRLSSRAYADYVNGSEQSNWTQPFWCLPGQIDGCHYAYRQAGRWLGAEQQLSWQPKADDSLATTFGYDVRLRDSSGRPAEYRDLVDNSYAIGTKQPYFHTQSVLGALFLQQLYTPVEWLTLNLGARLDIDSIFGTRLSPRAALVVMPTAQSSLRASYAEAFRGPTAVELNQSDATYVISPSSLGPEVVRTAELEWQQRIAWANISLRGYAAFYENLIDMRAATPDEIERAFTSGELASTADPEFVVTSDNVSKIRSYGGSATLQLHPVSGLTIAGSTTVSRSSSPATTLFLWPNVFGNARVSYEFRKGGPTLGFAALFAGKRPVFSDFDPEYVTVPSGKSDPQLDLRLTVSSPIRAVPGLSVRGGAGVRSWADQPYHLTGPTMAAPETPVQHIHDLPQLHLLLGANYDF